MLFENGCSSMTFGGSKLKTQGPAKWQAALLTVTWSFRVCCLLFSLTASPGFGVCIKIARCFAQRFAGLARLASKRCFGCQFGQAVGRSAPELVAFKDADAVENYAWGPSCQPLRSYWADFLFVWDGGGTRKILEVMKKITPISLVGCWWLVIGCWVCPLSNAFMASFTAAKVRSEEYGQPSHPWLCGVPQLQPGDCNFFGGLEQRRNLLFL